MNELLAHMTQEASDAIGQALLVLGITALTVLALVTWGLVVLIRTLRRRRDEQRTGEE